ncbi:excisionase family DNA-binding protein [Ralstonia sp. R-29]|uniref:excisionase family DNA-binding protein n=1 Tax=Ralstonia sp. R-29 TaxID=3404059 RepID=UPI003CFAC1A7
MAVETKSMHITPVGGNVFADLGFEPEEAAALKAESQRIISESTEVGAGCADVLLAIAEVADRLGVSRPYASMLADVGKLGQVTVAEDGHRRVRASAVDEYLAAREKQTEGAPSPREAGVDAGLYDYPERHPRRRW